MERTRTSNHDFFNVFSENFYKVSDDHSYGEFYYDLDRYGTHNINEGLFTKTHLTCFKYINESFSKPLEEYLPLFENYSRGFYFLLFSDGNRIITLKDYTNDIKYIFYILKDKTKFFPLFIKSKYSRLYGPPTFIERDIDNFTFVNNGFSSNEKELIIENPHSISSGSGFTSIPSKRFSALASSVFNYTSRTSSRSRKIRPETVSVNVKGHGFIDKKNYIFEHLFSYFDTCKTVLHIYKDSFINSVLNDFKEEYIGVYDLDEQDQENKRLIENNLIKLTGDINKNIIIFRPLIVDLMNEQIKLYKTLHLIEDDNKLLEMFRNKESKDPIYCILLLIIFIDYLKKPTLINQLYDLVIDSNSVKQPNYNLLLKIFTLVKNYIDTQYTHNEFLYQFKEKLRIFLRDYPVITTGDTTPYESTTDTTLYESTTISRVTNYTIPPNCITYNDTNNDDILNNFLLAINKEFDKLKDSETRRHINNDKEEVRENKRKTSEMTDREKLIKNHKEKYLQNKLKQIEKLKKIEEIKERIKRENKKREEREREELEEDNILFKNERESRIGNYSIMSGETIEDLKNQYNVQREGETVSDIITIQQFKLREFFNFDTDPISLSRNPINDINNDEEVIPYEKYYAFITLNNEGREIFIIVDKNEFEIALQKIFKHPNNNPNNIPYIRLVGSNSTFVLKKEYCEEIIRKVNNTINMIFYTNNDIKLTNDQVGTLTYPLYSNIKDIILKDGSSVKGGIIRIKKSKISCKNKGKIPIKKSKISCKNKIRKTKRNRKKNNNLKT